MASATWLLPLGLVAGVTNLPPLDLEAALKRPVSPASVAMLVDRPTDPRVRQRWREALDDPSPEVRAAAARAILVSRCFEIVPMLRKALEAETNPAAGGEEMAALVFLGGEADARAALAAARRLGRGDVVARCLARRFSSRVLTDFAEVWDLKPAVDRRTIALAGPVVPEGAPRLGMLAVKWQRPAMLADVAEQGHVTGVPLDPDIVLAAMASPVASLRRLAYWYAYRDGSPDGELLFSALDQTPEKSGRGRDRGALFFYRLLRRQVGPTIPEAAPVLATLLSPVPEGMLDGISERASIMWLLDEAERSAVSQALFGKPDLLNGDPKSAPPEEHGRLPVQTLRDLPAGLTADALRIFGCKTADPPQVRAGAITYNRDTRRGPVSLIGDLDAKDPCAFAAQVLLSNTVEPRDPVLAPDAGWDLLGGREETLVLALSASHLECTLPSPNPDANGGWPYRVGGKIAEPKKVISVGPIYPPSARSERVEGEVVLKATLSPTGCVAAIDVMSSPDPRLSIEAIRAVAGWTYAPTLVDKVAVPIVLSVPVSFHLN